MTQKPGGPSVEMYELNDITKSSRQSCQGKARGPMANWKTTVRSLDTQAQLPQNTGTFQSQPGKDLQYN